MEVSLLVLSFIVLPVLAPASPGASSPGLDAPEASIASGGENSSLLLRDAEMTGFLALSCQSQPST